MKVKFLVEVTKQIDNIASKTWPAGWQGNVDDEFGADLVAEGKVQQLADDPVDVALTPQQTAVLAAAADQAIAEAASQPVEPDEGEGDESEALAAEDLSKLGVADLRAMAAERGITGYATARKSDLVAALAAA